MDLKQQTVEPRQLPNLLVVLRLYEMVMQNIHQLPSLGIKQETFEEINDPNIYLRLHQNNEILQKRQEGYFIANQIDELFQQATQGDYISPNSQIRKDITDLLGTDHGLPAHFFPKKTSSPGKDPYAVFNNPGLAEQQKNLMSRAKELDARIDSISSGRYNI